MKVYPEPQKKSLADEAGLDSKDRITRLIAIAVAFISVFFFFVKLLFF